MATPDGGVAMATGGNGLVRLAPTEPNVVDVVLVSLADRLPRLAGGPSPLDERLPFPVPFGFGMVSLHAQCNNVH